MNRTGSWLFQFGLSVFFCLLTTFGSAPAAAAAETPDPDVGFALTGYALDMLEAINDLRVRDDLPKLIPDRALSEAAAKQAAYMLEIGQLSERGPKRESARMMVMDFGYAGGAPFELNQNIASSWEATEAETVLDEVWLKSPIQKVRLLNSEADHIGIGTAARNSYRYIVVYTGWLRDGSLLYTPVPTYDARTPKPRITATLTPEPIAISTRNPDGSILHIVKKDETLSEIAIAYNVDWYYLSNLNLLDWEDPVIFEGEEMLIEEKYTQTPTLTASLTPLPPTRTTRPTFTDDATARLLAQTPAVPQVTKTQVIQLDVNRLIVRTETYRKPVGIALIVLSFFGLILSFVIRKHNRRK